MPAIESLPHYLLDNNNRHIPTENVFWQLKRALSYIIIANKKKAWIYDDTIIDEAKKDVKWFLTNEEHISEEGMKRIKVFNQFLISYDYNELTHLSLIKDPNISHDFFDVLDSSLVKELSEKGCYFGLISHKYDILDRDIKEIITRILQSSKTPYLLSGAGILASLQGDMGMGVLTSSMNAIAHALRNVDLREYAPSMRKENLFILPKYTKTFKISYFNMEYKVFKKEKYD